MSTPSKVYAGIGSRATPELIRRMMTQTARERANTGEWLLRSGGARGADMAFEAGVVSSANPYLREIFTSLSDIPGWAFAQARHFHPNWEAVEEKGIYVMRLMARNSLIIFGRDGMSPVNEILCWTPGGAITGGTGQALRIAQHYKITVHNFALLPNGIPELV